MAQEILAEPGLVDDYIAGGRIAGIRTLVSSQLRLAGWPALTRLSKKDHRLRHAEPDRWRVAEMDVLHLRQLLCQYRFPRQNHSISIPPLVSLSGATLEHLTSNGGKIGNCDAIKNADCSTVASRFANELHAASWPLFPESASVCIGRRLISDAAESAYKTTEQASSIREASKHTNVGQIQPEPAHDAVPHQKANLPGSSLHPSTTLQSKSPGSVGSAESTPSLDMSVSTVRAPIEAAMEGKAASAQVTRHQVNRPLGAGQAVLRVSCPSPEDVRKADEAAASLIQSEQATKACKAEKSAKAKKRRQQRQKEQEQQALHSSDSQASMLPESDPPGRFLMQWVLHLTSRLVWTADFWTALS